METGETAAGYGRHATRERNRNRKNIVRKGTGRKDGNMITIIRRNRQEIENAGGLYVYRLILAAVIAFYAVILAAVVLLTATTVNAAETGGKNARTEATAGTVKQQIHDGKKLVKEYARRNFRGYKVKVRAAERLTDQELEKRAGKNIVYSDYYVTVSRGKYGTVTTKGPFYGRRINYAKRAGKGEKVVVFLVYNPATKATDDILAIISGGTIRQ